MKYEILHSRSIIKVSGLDAVNFLQGLTTNLISKSSVCYSLMLSSQGRYLCDFFVFPCDDSFYLSIISSAKERLLQKLKFYKLRSKVDIIDESSRYKHLYGHSLLDAKTFKDPRNKQLGFWSIVLDEDIQKLDPKLICSNLYNQDKYELAIPEGDIDMLPDKALPPEYGIDMLHGISYTKGCYIGQEVIARTKYQGIVRKKICSATLTNYLSDDLSNYHHGSQITFEGQKIGILTSSFGNKAIALIRTHEDGSLPSSAYIGEQKVLIKLATWYM
jgi:folate-binding protein YgfZ